MQLDHAVFESILCICVSLHGTAYWYSTCSMQGCANQLVILIEASTIPDLSKSTTLCSSVSCYPVLLCPCMHIVYTTTHVSNSLHKDKCIPFQVSIVVAPHKRKCIISEYNPCRRRRCTSSMPSAQTQCHGWASTLAMWSSSIAKLARAGQAHSLQHCSCIR